MADYVGRITKTGGGRCLAQLIASTRDWLGAGGGGNTAQLLDSYWSDLEIIVALNYAKSQLWKVAKNLREDLFQEVMQSTDAAGLIRGINYDPASLRLAVGQNLYVLPPDFAEIKAIRCITSGYEGATFVGMDSAKEPFKTLLGLGSQETSADSFFFDIVGRRNLLIAPKPQVALDLEIVYTRRLGFMHRYNTGTVSVTTDSATVTGVDTNFNGQGGVLPGWGLIVGPIVDPTADYPIVKTVDSPTQVTLEQAWSGAILGGQEYSISAVPEMELEDDELLVVSAVIQMHLKGSSPNYVRVNLTRPRYKELLADFKASLTKRIIGDVDYVEPYLEGF